MEDTTVKPINTTEIALRGILDKIAEAQLDSDYNDTFVSLPTSYDSTASPSNNIPIDLRHNRKVCRYAKKHKISTEEAFKRLYK